MEWSEAMTLFSLEIRTPEGLVYGGQAAYLGLVTGSGEMGVLAGHMDCIAPLVPGKVILRTGDAERRGVCAGGIIHIRGGVVRLAARDFSWETPIREKGI